MAICRRILTAFVVLLALSGGPALAVDKPSGTAADEVKIAVLAFRGRDEALLRWLPTAHYLNALVEGHYFRIVPLTLPEMSVAVATGKVDFVLTNPGNYVELEAAYGITRIATLTPKSAPTTGNVFGAVIFTRADRTDIRTLEDLKGKSFMAVERHGFGGFQMAWRELKAHGIDPFADFSRLSFSGFPQDVVVQSVLAGKADAGTFRTGTLEQMDAEGVINFDNLRVLNPQDHPGYPFAVSTRLYPEWPFAQVKHTPQQLSQEVVIQLLRMHSDHPAARIGRYAGWTVPLDYQPVHELFRELRIGPYDVPVEITLKALFEQHWEWAVFAAVLVAIALLWGWRIEHLVARRTEQLSQANLALETQIVERRRAEEDARRRQIELAHISRVSTMGELTASLAHEINQPLAAIANYAQGSVRRITGGNTDMSELLDVLRRMASEAERAGEVIRRIRALVRKGEVVLEPLDINALVREACEITQPEAQRQNIRIDLKLMAGLPTVTCDKVQIEQVLLNLIGNALEAMSDTQGDQRSIIITTAIAEDGAVGVTVRDFGSGLPDGAESQLFEPFFTTKRKGMGMGLSISRTIVEAGGGRLSAHPADGRGTVFAFTLPRHKRQSTDMPSHEEIRFDP